MRNYNHLNSSEIDTWNEKLLQKSLPKRAFSNTLTSNIMLSMESMISVPAKLIQLIKAYKNR